MNLITISITLFVVIRRLDGALDPLCIPRRATPACTYNKSEVTPTLPTCVLPIEQYLKCRSIPGMGSTTEKTVPTWFDYKWARRGQDISNEYRLPWYYNMFNGILVEMIMPDILHPLLFNKKNVDGVANAKRDLATIMQGMIWTKEYLKNMPEEGHSLWLQSIQSVRRVHKDVQTRGYERIQSKGCLVDIKDYVNIETDDETWDAFEKDLAASDLLRGKRHEPASSWPTCADTTTCSLCGSSCSTNCVDICGEEKTILKKSFGPGQMSSMVLENAEIASASLVDETEVEGTFSSVFFSGDGNWVNGTGSDGKVYKSGEMQGGIITKANIITASYTNKMKLTGGTLSNGIYAHGSLVSGRVENSISCAQQSTNCSECKNCHTCAWKSDSCYVASPATFNCENCMCNGEGKKCQNCTGCTNYEKCLNFTIPLYNQQGLGFVVFNLVAFPILWPNEVGITACDADMWALNHLWAGILHGLGTDDECNVLLLPDIQSARIYYKQIFDTYLLPTLFKLDKATRYMMDNVFQGLKILTATTFTPKLLLCRFLRDFLKIPAQHMCGLLDLKDKVFDGLVGTSMMPQFLNDSNYRAVLNQQMDDRMSDDANIFFPKGQCSTFKRIANECFA